MRSPRIVGVMLVATLPANGQNLSHDLPHRGAHVYERTTEQFEILSAGSRVRPEWLVHDGSADTPHEWRYHGCAASDVPAGFEQPNFDDRSWLTGPGEFGPDAATQKQQRSSWRQDVLCLRTTASLGKKKPRALWFVIDHDDGVRVWLNGKLVVADDGFGRGRCYVVMGNAVDAWSIDGNVLAAKCTNTGGAQYLDVAIAAIHSLPPGVRTAEQLVRVVREDHENSGRVQRDLFGAFRPPPLLLQGELDGKGQFVVIPPGDLRDLAWWLAVDLRAGAPGGAVQADAWRLHRLGDLQVRGKASAVGADGWQTLELTVKNTLEPAPRGDSKRFVDRHVRPFVWYGFDGTLAIKRRLEVRNGKAKVAEFTTDLDGRCLQGAEWKDVKATVRQRETWSWARTHDNQDAEFRAQVARALQRGTTQLKEQVRNPGAGDIQAQAEDASNSFHSGRLALGLLALLKGGVGKDDEVVMRGYAELRRRRLVDSYSLANGIMAIEALYAPGNEAGDLRTGTLERPRKRQPTPDDTALLQRWTTQLLGNVDTRVDRDYLLRFNYTAGDRFDNSVNQYALLGLHSAHLCGIEIKTGIWEAAANHLLASQADGGAKIQLDLVDYRTLARRQADPQTPFTGAQPFGRANGWSYHEPKSDGEFTPTWGSMTCAGITGLAICEAGLADQPQKRPKVQAEARRARNDGFAWLASYMTPRQHAGAIERQQQWVYYYLYSLERAAMLSGIALIQDRDWYFEGAMVLVLAQLGDGNWPSELHHDAGIERNAMAILFLKQSTLPVLTGR